MMPSVEIEKMKEKIDDEKEKNEGKKEKSFPDVSGDGKHKKRHFNGKRSYTKTKNGMKKKRK